VILYLVKKRVTSIVDNLESGRGTVNSSIDLGKVNWETCLVREGVSAIGDCSILAREIRSPGIAF
jgi:hypothetical protein